MLLHEELDSITAEFGSSDSREERIVIGAGPFPEPDIQNLLGFLS